MEEKGLLITATSPDEKLVEIVEYRDHPWGIGVQFHPEFKSKALNAHALFSSLIRELFDSSEFLDSTTFQRLTDVKVII